MRCWGACAPGISTLVGVSCGVFSLNQSPTPLCHRSNFCIGFWRLPRLGAFCMHCDEPSLHAYCHVSSHSCISSPNFTSSFTLPLPTFLQRSHRRGLVLLTQTPFLSLRLPHALTGLDKSAKLTEGKSCQAFSSQRFRLKPSFVNDL